MMDVIFYFAFGALNICLLYLFIILYKRNTGVDLEIKDKFEMGLNVVTCFLSGPFGTVMLILLGLFLYNMWRKYYRKK
jgi:hypothetical protein